jgi:hypothetical protein
LTAKEYLSQAFILGRLIKAKEAHVQNLRDMQERVTHVLSNVRVQVTPATDTMAEVTAKLVDLIEEYTRDVIRLQDIEREIKTAIDTVKKDDHRLILYERYINLKRWEDIAADNNYSWKWVHVLHNRALTDVKEYMEIHNIDVA